jgi:hypothetical protein
MGFRPSLNTPPLRSNEQIVRPFRARRSNGRPYSCSTRNEDEKRLSLKLRRTRFLLESCLAAPGVRPKPTLIDLDRWVPNQEPDKRSAQESPEV